MNPFKYLRLFMGLVYIAFGLYFITNPILENQVLSYLLAGAIFAYGAMRSYMGYNEIYRNRDNTIEKEKE